MSARRKGGKPNVFGVLQSATERARKAWLRQQQAAKHCIGGEARRLQLTASSAKAAAVVDDLVFVEQAVGEILEAARRLEVRGFFARSSCADKATNTDMTAMRAALKNFEVKR